MLWSPTQDPFSYENQSEPPKSRSEMEKELDIISNLPSGVKEQILSSLSIEEALRTSVLSSKWRYTWARLPDLVFDGQCVSTENHATIDRIVDHVLLLHIGPIHKFKLSHPKIIASSDIDRWILHVSRNGIKELILDKWEGPYYKTPSCLFSCQDLIHLELWRCLLKPPPAFKGFRSLKSLDIQYVTLAQEVFEILIACSPLLEKLFLKKCDGFTHLKIDAPSLQDIVVIGVYVDFTLENTLNLARVYIDLDVNVDQTQVPGSSSKLVNSFVPLLQIQRLKICRHFLKYLAVGALPEKLPKPFLHLNYLSIQNISFNVKNEILTALCLLRSSPALQVLKIKAYKEDQAVVEEVNYWLNENHTSLFTQLRHVKITGITGVKDELYFIIFLLVSSPVLERMTIRPASVNCSSNLLTKLLQFRHSSNAEIIYDDS